MTSFSFCASRKQQNRTRIKDFTSLLRVLLFPAEREQMKSFSEGAERMRTKQQEETYSEDVKSISSNTSAGRSFLFFSKTDKMKFN